MLVRKHENFFERVERVVATDCVLLCIPQMQIRGDENSHHVCVIALRTAEVGGSRWGSHRVRRGGKHR